MDGEVTKRAAFDHVTPSLLEGVLPQFRGQIQQVPPIFSAIRKNGQRLYEQARKGELSADATVEARTVQIDKLELTTHLPCFDIHVECGGGTYIRSLVRDIAAAVDTVATTTALRRTRQGPFRVETALQREDWSVDNINAEIRRIKSLESNTVV